jgi:hypothetical protein
VPLDVGPAAGTAQNAIRDTSNPVPGVHMSAAPSSNEYRGGSTVQGPADEEGHWPGRGHGEKRGG